MPFCSGEYDLGHVTDDCSNSVDLEEIKISCFVDAGCKCKLANGNPCSQLFSASMYRSLRDECHALTRDELDLVPLPQRQKDTKTKSRNAEHVRLLTQFRFVGHCVCINTFCFCTQ